VDLEEMFDSPNRYQKRTKTGGEITIRNPSFVMAGGLTRSDFEKYIREEDMLGGFLTRMLFIMLESKRTDVRGLEVALASEPERKKLTEHLTVLYEVVKAQRKPDTKFREATEIEVTRVAMQELDRYTRRIREMDVDSVLFGFRNRLGQYALKLGMCYALSRVKEGEELKVMGEDIRHAVSFLEYQRSRAWPVVLDVAGLQDRSARQLWRVRSMLQSLQKEATEPDGDWTETWVNLRLLLKHLHMTVGAFGVFKDTLLEAGQVNIRARQRPFTKDRLGRQTSGRGQIQIILTPAGWISDVVAQ
jgi:hypothetical protein